MDTPNFYFCKKKGLNIVVDNEQWLNSQCKKLP